MNLIMRLGALAAAALLWPAAASAQGAAAVSLTPPDVRRWELSADVGWLSNNKSAIASGWNDWLDVPFAGGSLGRSITPALKADVRLAIAGEGHVYEEQRIDVPGQPFPAFRLVEHRVRTTTLSGGIVYQFFENRWFHPHVGAGLEIGRESDRVLTEEQRVPPPGAQMFPALDRGTRLSWHARPVVSTGFKWYVNERGFIRSDLRVTVGAGRAAQVAWTAGIGVDL
jgi:opacity protein-like surface antigen